MTYGKRDSMVVHEAEPLNAETARADLAEGVITATDVFYVRGHGPVPEIDHSRWHLDVAGLVDQQLSLTIGDLRSRFEIREIVATLQCAGNRRAGLQAVRAIPGEAPWGPGATGTAVWSGVALADVLDAAGVAEAAAHVGFGGADQSPEADPPQDYGASIPMAKALQHEVLLALDMNGQPLSPVHGAPVRVVVPGYIGARSVKWLKHIDVRAEPWDGFFQATVYRLLPPEAEAAPGVGIPLGEVALNSEVLVPDDGATVKAGPVEVRGYAFAGGRRHVTRVDVSTDEGTTWQQAELLEDLGPWAWRTWQTEVDLDRGPQDIVVRAWDSTAATQPEQPATVWNPKGYVNNSWGRVSVQAG